MYVVARKGEWVSIESHSGSKGYMKGHGQGRGIKIKKNLEKKWPTGIEVD